MLLMFIRLYGSSGRPSCELLDHSPSVKKKKYLLYLFNLQLQIGFIVGELLFFSKAELYLMSNLQCPFNHLLALVPVELIARSLIACIA